MRQIVTRRVKLKAGAVAVAVLDAKPTMEELEAPEQSVVLARRDLVFLQALFAALDRGYKVADYKRMQRAVITSLDSLTQMDRLNSG